MVKLSQRRVDRERVTIVASLSRKSWRLSWDFLYCGLRAFSSPAKTFERFFYNVLPCLLFEGRRRRRWRTRVEARPAGNILSLFSLLPLSPSPFYPAFPTMAWPAFLSLSPTCFSVAALCQWLAAPSPFLSTSL